MVLTYDPRNGNQGLAAVFVRHEREKVIMPGKAQFKNNLVEVSSGIYNSAAYNDA